MVLAWAEVGTALTPPAPPQSSMHPAFHHLTAVHKSDYITAYVSHHHGGLMHDVKSADPAAWRLLFKAVHPRAAVQKPEKTLERPRAVWIAGWRQGVGRNEIACTECQSHLLWTTPHASPSAVSEASPSRTSARCTRSTRRHVSMECSTLTMRARASAATASVTPPRSSCRFKRFWPGRALRSPPTGCDSCTPISITRQGGWIARRHLQACLAAASVTRAATLSIGRSSRATRCSHSCSSTHRTSRLCSARGKPGQEPAEPARGRIWWRLRGCARWAPLKLSLPDRASVSVGGRATAGWFCSLRTEV
mmetsp:Transcript_59469/g.176588  ORF Transcript_59469/g.176588 Transcript_59469/m.176588 type:complete len:307 (+) Transcript_59469:206-1126(+)